MSLFIAGLAFEHAGGAYCDLVRLGILIGSTLAAIFGCLVLWLGPKLNAAENGRAG